MKILRSVLAVLFVCCALVLALRAAKADSDIDAALQAASQAMRQSDVTEAVNSAMHQMLVSSNITDEGTERVVPIISADGRLSPHRLAQVNGSLDSVVRVHAVLEIDSGVSHTPWQFTALIPIAGFSRNGHPRRVADVGVSALVTR